MHCFFITTIFLSLIDTSYGASRDMGMIGLQENKDHVPIPVERSESTQTDMGKGPSSPVSSAVKTLKEKTQSYDQDLEQIESSLKEVNESLQKASGDRQELEEKKLILLEKKQQAQELIQKIIIEPRPRGGSGNSKVGFGEDHRSWFE